MKKILFLILVFIFIGCESPKKFNWDEFLGEDDADIDSPELDKDNGNTGDDKFDFDTIIDEDKELGDTGNVSDSDDSSDSGDSGDTGGNKECTPKTKQKCVYSGLPKNEDVGACKAGLKTCSDEGEWGVCEGEVLPEEEWGDLCKDTIDNDCDGTVDNGTDVDGDGYPACEDCCEVESQCPDPASVWNSLIHICSHDENNLNDIYKCDDTLDSGSKEPMDYVKSIGLCRTATDDVSSGWGVISAEILKPDGSFGASLASSAMLDALGSIIKPPSGVFMMALSTGEAANPFPSAHKSMSGASSAPADWYSANGNKLPNAPGCPNATSINDAIMLKLKIRVPELVKSFSFNINFLSVEYPTYVCTKYNDFFVALLDSTHTSDNPDLQNPADKNLAMDENGYPVGVNLAKSGLFKVCAVSSTYPSCAGDGDLEGTGWLEGHGGTGWLTVRGNVVPGEVITLRLATWDSSDQIWDSIVLVDNFKWSSEEFKPGTGDE